MKRTKIDLHVDRDAGVVESACVFRRLSVKEIEISDKDRRWS